MQRFWLTASLLLSACGPGMAKHDTTPPPQQAGKQDPNELVCNDEDIDPRASTRPHCRRRGDIDDDRRRAQDVVNYGTPSQRTR
jgi:hypothetical protein